MGAAGKSIGKSNFGKGSVPKGRDISRDDKGGGGGGSVLGKPPTPPPRNVIPIAAGQQPQKMKMKG